MHPCWAIDEILQHILLCIDEGGKRGYTLAALATSCKNLYEPSMNHLWAKLDNIAPLIRCMPNDVWWLRTTPAYGAWYSSSHVQLVSTHILTLNTPTSQLTFIEKLLRSPSTEEWTYLAKHARRVRRISLSITTTSMDVDFDAILALNKYLAESSLSGAPPLFPNLEDLTLDYFMTLRRNLIGIWKCLGALSMGGRLLKIFLTGRPVVSFEDEHVEAMTDVGSGLLNMTRGNSGLQVFVCQSNGTSWLPVDTTILVNILGAMPSPKLRCLDLELISFPASMITLLASFEHLSTLSIKIHESVVVGLPLLPFNALTSLVLRSPHLHCCVSMIGIITSSHLTHLTLHSDPWHTMDEARNLFSVVARHRALSSLFISLNSGFDDDSPLRQITEFQTEYGLADVLEPTILSLTKLKDFQLRGMVRLDVDEKQMLYLAKAWPDIEQLVLEPHQASGLGPMDVGPRQVPIKLLPFTALATIAAHFPRLRRLFLVMDHTLASPVHRETYSNIKMRDLYIAVDTIKHLDVREVARYLHALYPKVEYCRFDIADADDDRYGWNRELETILGSEAAEDEEG